MGILTDKVDNAFEKLRQGNFNEFVREIADAGDVRYAGHKHIVMMRIEENLDRIKLESWGVKFE